MVPIQNLTEEPSCSLRNPTKAEFELDDTLQSVEVCACVEDLCNIFSSSGTTVNGSSFNILATMPTTHSGGQNEHHFFFFIETNFVSLSI